MKIFKSILAVLFSLAMFTILFHTQGVEIGTAIYASTVLNGCIAAAKYLGLMQLPTGVFAEYVSGPGDGSNGVTVFTNERKRGAFMHVFQKPEYQGKKISQSYLRLETPISNTNGTLEFKHFEGDSTSVGPNEIRLKRSDAFEIIGLQFMIMRETPNKTNGRPQSFPNPVEFGAAAAADLYSVYNGYLQFSVAGNIWMPNYPLLQFLDIPVTQQSASTNSSQFSNWTANRKWTPHFTLDGSGSNRLQAIFQTHANWAGATPVTAGDLHKAVLIAHGFLINEGSTSVK